MRTRKPRRRSLIFDKRRKTQDPPAEPKNDAPEPEVKLPRIKKRTSRPYVYTDQGVLVVRTPAETTKWSHDFRLRIIRDYVPPRTIKMGSDFRKNFLENGNQETVYRVAGKSVRVIQPYEEVSGAFIVLRTEVIDVTTKRALFLNHQDAAMRMLIVFAFLKEKKIVGIPDLQVADWTP